LHRRHLFKGDAGSPCASSITGSVGSRQIVFAWYAGTYQYGNQQQHFTVTLFEDDPNEVIFKYYDVDIKADQRANTALYWGNYCTSISASNSS